MRLGLTSFFICALTIMLNGQVPAGPPYDPGIHPNPIVTFVETASFRPVTYDEARMEAEIELLGLSARDGTRNEIALAPGGALEVRVLGRKTEALVFPVIRQTFALKGGELFLLYSFRNLRTDLPPSDAETMLNAEALTPPRRPGEGRFGMGPMPEETSVRGRAALFFEEEGRHTLFWQEDRVSHVGVSAIDSEEFFSLLEDLL